MNIYIYIYIYMYVQGGGHAGGMHLRACLCGQHGCPRLVPLSLPSQTLEPGKFTVIWFWDGPNAVLMIAASGRPIEDAQKQPLGTLNAYAGYIVGCAAVFPLSVLSFQLHDGCWCATFRLSCEASTGMPTPSPATGAGGPASSHSRNWAITIGKLFRPRSSRPGGCSASCTCSRALLSLFSATPATHLINPLRHP
jgi:hypothetical protein